jgi:hypothetical protein
MWVYVCLPAAWVKMATAEYYAAWCWSCKLFDRGTASLACVLRSVALHACMHECGGVALLFPALLFWKAVLGTYHAGFCYLGLVGGGC